MAIAQSTRAKIHIARQQLCMDDDSYRMLLERVAGDGITSSTQLTPVTAAKVLHEFERLGFKAKKPKAKGKPKNFDSAAMPAMIEKIEAQLADMGLAWAYADAIAARMFGIERCAWVREPKQLRAIIAALHNEQKKRYLLSDLEWLMTKLGSRDPKWQALLDQQPDGWQRSIPKLKKLVGLLYSAGIAGGLLDVDGR